MRDIQKKLPDLINRATAVFTDAIPSVRPSHDVDNFNQVFAPQGTGLIQTYLGKTKVHSLRHIIDELRVVKSDAEAAVMRKAGKMSGRAFTLAMGESFLSEKELADFLEYHFKVNGCDKAAYVPVVAGGAVSSLAW